MISYEEAQELHMLVGGPIEVARDNYEGDLEVSGVMVKLSELERAREIAGALVSDLDPETHPGYLVHLTEHQIGMILEAIDDGRMRAERTIENAKKDLDDATIQRAHEAIADYTQIEGDLRVTIGELADWDTVWGNSVLTGPHGDVIQFDPDSGDEWSPQEERLTWSIVVDGGGYRLRAIPGYAKHSHILYYVMCKSAWTDADTEKDWLY